MLSAVAIQIKINDALTTAQRVVFSRYGREGGPHKNYFTCGNMKAILVARAKLSHLAGRDRGSAGRESPNLMLKLPSRCPGLFISSFEIVLQTVRRRLLNACGFLAGVWVEASYLHWQKYVCIGRVGRGVG